MLIGGLLQLVIHLLFNSIVVFVDGRLVVVNFWLLFQVWINLLEYLVLGISPKFLFLYILGYFVGGIGVTIIICIILVSIIFCLTVWAPLVDLNGRILRVLILDVIVVTGVIVDDSIDRCLGSAWTHERTGVVAGCVWVELLLVFESTQLVSGVQGISIELVLYLLVQFFVDFLDP